MQILGGTNPLLNSILYSFLGIAILVIAFIIVEVITPKHNLWKEVVEKQNMALALVAVGVSWPRIGGEVKPPGREFLVGAVVVVQREAELLEVVRTH